MDTFGKAGFKRRDGEKPYIRELYGLEGFEAQSTMKVCPEDSDGWMISLACCQKNSLPGIRDRGRRQSGSAGRELRALAIRYDLLRFMPSIEMAEGRNPLPLASSGIKNRSLFSETNKIGLSEPCFQWSFPLLEVIW